MRKIVLFLLLCLSTLFAKEKFVVVFAQDTMDNDWRVAQVKEVEEAFKRYPNVKFSYTNGMGEISKQIKNIEDILSKKIDLLITSPKGAKAMTPIISKVYQNKTPVVLLSRTIMSKDYTSFIHPDNELIAKQAAKFIANKLDYKGNILILQHTQTTTPGMLRTKGFLDEIKKYKDIKVVALKEANSLRSEAILKIEEAIRDDLKFNAIYAQSDSMAIGAVLALKKNKIDPTKIIITGIDYISESVEYIKKGEIDATYLYPTAGKEGVDVAIKILEGKKVPKEIVINSTEITKENVDTIKPIF